MMQGSFGNRELRRRKKKPHAKDAKDARDATQRRGYFARQCARVHLFTSTANEGEFVSDGPLTPCFPLSPLVPRGERGE